MFVRYFVELPVAYQVVEDSLLCSPEDWIPRVARDVDARGEQLLVEVGFGGSRARLGRRVEIALGQPLRFPSKLVLPVSWKAVHAEGLFPSLDADIEVGPVGPARTQLSMSARYKPPLGPLGAAADRALLHRVAEATIKDFVDRVAERIAASVTSAA